MNGRAWTQPEIAKLRRLIGEGFSQRDAATELNRSVDAVRTRCQKLRLPTGRYWTPEDLAELRRAIAAGETQKSIAGRLGRSVTAVANRCQVLGIHNREAALANSKAAMAKHRPESKRKIAQSWTPERRAKQAEVARRVAAARTYSSPSEKTKAAVREGSKRWHRTRWAWCPEEYRPLYKSLTRNRGMKAAEAREIVQQRIRDDFARLTPFERQMKALERGASLIAKPVYRTRDYDFTLGGVTPIAA